MKEIRSKIIAVAAVALFAVSVTACESAAPDSSTSTADNSSGSSVSTEAPVPEYDDNGNKVSAVEVTDANGAAVTDANGAAVTELVLVDDKGTVVTEADGSKAKPVISSSSPAATAATTNSLDAIGKPEAMKDDTKSVPQQKVSYGPTVSLPDVEASAGETVTFKINVTNNTGITALVAWVEANKDYFEFDKAACVGGDADAADNEDSDPYSNLVFTKFDNPEAEDMDTLSCFYFDGSQTSLEGDVVLATVALKVKEGTPAGKYDLVFDADGDGEGRAMCNDYKDGIILIHPVTYENGSITVK